MTENELVDIEGRAVAYVVAAVIVLAALFVTVVVSQS